MKYPTLTWPATRAVKAQQIQEKNRPEVRLIEVDFLV
jgi:hypothetical protein